MKILLKMKTRFSNENFIFNYSIQFIKLNLIQQKNFFIEFRSRSLSENIATKPNSYQIKVNFLIQMSQRIHLNY